MSFFRTDAPPTEAEFRRVQLHGRFDHDREFYLAARSQNGNVGYWVVTPFLLADGGGAVLVNRGWVPNEKKLPETRPDHITGGGLRFILGESRELFSDRRFIGYVSVCAIGTATFFAFLGGGPHVVVSIMARTSAEYGLWFIATSGGFMLGNFITSRTSQRYGVDRMIGIGLVLLLIGSVLTIATVAAFPDGGPWTIFVPQLAISIGNGIFLPNCVAGAVSVRPRAAGTASGITGFVQMATGAVAAQGMSHIIATATTAMPLAIAMGVLSAAASIASSRSAAMAR